MITEYAFKKMNKMARRMAICRDVLKQIAAEKLIPKQGTFLIAYNPTGDYKQISGKSGQQLVNEPGYCHVCAKGALVCSYVSNFNNKSYGQMHNIYVTGDNELIDIFGGEIWYELENHFEHKGVELVDLMKNIIKNKGKFRTNYGKLIG